MPRFNYRILTGIGIIIMSTLLFIALVMFIVVRYRSGQTPAETPGTGIGALPGIGEGSGGKVRDGEDGGLPSSGGGEEIPNPNDQIPNPEGGSEVHIDEVARGWTTRAIPIVQGFPLNPEVARNGGIQYYDPREQKFYRTTAEGGKRLLSDEEFPGVVEVEWAPQGDSGILTYADGSHAYYDFINRTLAVLPKEMNDPAFRADGDAIVYKTETDDGRNNWLVVSSPDGSGARAVQATGENGAQVSPAWSPDYKIAAMFRKSRGIDREEIYFIGLEGENFTSLEVIGSRFEGKWAPDGTRILYHSVYASDEYRPHISLAEAGTNGSRRTLDLGFVTWVDRCTFSGDNRIVYCAVPGELPAGAGVVPQTGVDAEYEIRSYDIMNGLSALVAIPELRAGERVRGVRELEIAVDGSALFLETRAGMYRVRLK